MGTGKILLALHGSLPQMSTGYAIRSHALAKELLSMGFDLHICTMPGFPDNLPARREDAHDGIVYHRLPAPGLDGEAYRSAARAAYAEEIASSGAALVHAASDAQNGWPAIMAARDRGIPSIYEYRGLWHYTRCAAEPWFEHGEEFAKLHELELETGRQASHVFAISRALASELERNGMPAAKIGVLPNGVDIARFGRRSRNMELAQKHGLSGKRIIGFAGSINAYEGLDCLMDAVLSLHLEDGGIALLIVGGGQYLPALQKLHAARGGAGCVVFAGAIPPEQMPEYYSLMDIVVIPRRADKVCQFVPPLKPLEAMAMGIPVVAANLPPLREMIRDGENGLLFTPESRGDLIRCLKRLLAGPELRQKLAANGAQWVERERQWRQIAQNAATAYERLGARTTLPVGRHTPKTAMGSAKDRVFRKPSGPWLRVAAIMDEFTFHTFQPECVLLQLEPDKWKEQIKKFEPDLLFVESAWQGKNSLWQRKVSGCAPELRGLIAYCKEAGIPTMFWNKEDPPHFDTFLPVAREVDFVFTTDIDCIPGYKHHLGHDRVYLLPFAVQPRLHNPMEKYERQDKFCFAGSYYLRYPERQRDFDVLYTVLDSLKGIDIFDRNYGKDHPHYIFPPKYRHNIIGALAYNEIDKAYKGYRYGVNMNTGKQSQTMFARRVYELAASNTLIVSNFSRGLRNFFGDLVIASDNEDELRRRLEPIISDETHYRKLRLLALRHVLEKHTSRMRLEYICGKVWQLASARKASIVMLAKADTEEEAGIAVANFARQTWENKTLFVIGKTLPPVQNAHLFPDSTTCARAIKDGDFQLIGAFATSNYYGASYFKDMALALNWSQAGILGKKARYIMENGHLRLLENDTQYKPASALSPFCSMARGEQAANFLHAFFTGADKIEGACEALDEFNFVENCPSSDKISPALDIESSINNGLDLANQILPLAERLPAFDSSSEHSATIGVKLPPDKLIGGQIKNQFIDITITGETLHINSRLASDQHIYLPGRIFKREAINLLLNSTVNIDFQGDLDIQMAFIFRDINKEKISHMILKSGQHSLVIPHNCQLVEIRFRISGPGSATVGQLELGMMAVNPKVVACKSDLMIITKQYPAYDNIYKYGFLHSRVLAYKQYGIYPCIYQISKDDCYYREYEGIDVCRGNNRLLEDTLASGQIKLICVHLIDRNIWNVIKQYIDKIKIIIWIHGAEIQSWKRREFEFVDWTPKEIEKHKKITEAYKELWREIIELNHPDIHYIFISKSFLQESEEDIDMRFPEDRCHIIHNYIDSNFYVYAGKNVADRFKVLTIRPFQARKYGTDLAVKTILHLANEPEFPKFQFTICGDGYLFDKTVAPIRGFENVHLEQRFLTRAEMLAKYKENGVCLMPSRADAQGVARDEAMSCGLVPVTNDVGAISEFVDDTCGFLAPPEDTEAMAKALLRLAREPELFMRLSKNAAEQVRRLSGYKETIERELALIKG